MDRIKDTDTMIKIELGKEGRFLSGRSRVSEILGKFDPNALRADEVQISFADVESCSQSFVSELVFKLKEFGVQKGKIKVSDIADKEIERRVSTELHRLDMI
ncbi:MAG: STAS-like domain-containing protein [Calothrix sp. SM1_5_4]|nr:STAS-like domain-containing protein [Calothrix sp. SM1_5_4]